MCDRIIRRRRQHTVHVVVPALLGMATRVLCLQRFVLCNAWIVTDLVTDRALGCMTVYVAVLAAHAVAYNPVPCSD